MQLSDRLEVKRLLDREVERVNSIEPRVQSVVRGDWVVVLADGRLVREWRWWVSTDVPGILEHAGNWTSVAGNVAEARVALLIASAP